jgi:outer membrane protein TolC
MLVQPDHFLRHLAQRLRRHLYVWRRRLLTGQPADYADDSVVIRPAWWKRQVPAAACGIAIVVAPLITGCATSRKPLSELSWCDDKDDHVVTSYRGYNAKAEHVCLDNETAPSVQATIEPRNLLRRVEEEIQSISLHDVIQTALSNNEIIETSSFGGVGSSAILNNPRFASSVYDPAIQESGVLFGGGLGLEAALSRFDTQFTTSALWGRSSATLVPRETGAFRSALSKQFATGGTVELSHNWNYLGTPTGVPFNSAYTGNLGLTVRQPLLAGSGVEYNRIAGPTNPAFGAITGVGQGVVIARINNDITIADFELAVRDSVRDIENAYWDLYLAYRTFDTAVIAHRSARRTWREARDKADVGILNPADELQAKDRLFETKANVEQTLSSIFRAESELRRLIGLPVNDGRVLRPSDDPAISEYVPDWESSLQQGLRQRTELRAQKFRVKSTQLQLSAARSLVRPTVNAVGSYDINGFGDRLIDDGIVDPGTGLPIRSGYGSFGTAGLESWTMGVEVTIPLGYRSPRSQVRNLELQLAKDTAILAAQERNVTHEIAISVQEVTAAFATAQSHYKRRQAAVERVRKLNFTKEVGAGTLDLVLRAQASAAEADGAYYQQVVNYNKALVNLNLSTGSLLEYNGVYLAEGPWARDAHRDAAIHAAERTHATANSHLHTEPAEFISPGPAGTIERRPIVPRSGAKWTVPEVPVPEAAPRDAVDDQADRPRRGV